MQAAHLIHRLYGGNRRLPEVEKRRLETLISTRNQITKEVWKRNVDTTTIRLENAVTALRSYQTEVAAAVRNLQNVVRDQRRVTTNGTSTTTGGRSYPLADDGFRNTPLFPDIRSSSNSRRNGSGQSNASGSFGGGLRLESASGASINDSIYGTDPLLAGELAGKVGGGGNTSKVLRWEATAGLEKITAAVADAVDMIRWSTDAWVAEREWLRNERSRCFLVLGIKETTAEGGDGNNGGAGARRLDAEVQQVLDKLNAALSLTKERAVDAEHRAASLEERLRTSRADVEDELRAKDRTISLLTTSLERAEKEAELSNGEGRELKRQLQVAKSELSHYSVKSKYLEKV